MSIHPRVPGESAIKIRLNMFPNGTEAYIHSHSTNCISACLWGGYEHTVWRVVRERKGALVHDGGGAALAAEAGVEAATAPATATAPGFSAKVHLRNPVTRSVRGEKRGEDCSCLWRVLADGALRLVP